MPQFGLRDNLIRCELLRNEEQYTYLEDFRYFASTHYVSLKPYFKHLLLFDVWSWLQEKNGHNSIFHHKRVRKILCERWDEKWRDASLIDHHHYWITMTMMTENLCKIQFSVLIRTNICLFLQTLRARMTVGPFCIIGSFKLYWCTIILKVHISPYFILCQFLSGYLQCQWADTKGRPSSLAELHSQPSWCVLCGVGDHFSATE